MKPLSYHIRHTFLIVGGNCEICKERIEKAALSVNGVSLASWSLLDGRLYLTFDPSLTLLEEISIAVAMAGHDTNLHKADQRVQDQMPDCCKSARKKY